MNVNKRQRANSSNSNVEEEIIVPRSILRKFNKHADILARNDCKTSNLNNQLQDYQTYVNMISLPDDFNSAKFRFMHQIINRTPNDESKLTIFKTLAQSKIGDITEGINLRAVKEAEVNTQITDLLDKSQIPDNFRDPILQHLQKQRETYKMNYMLTAQLKSQKAAEKRKKALTQLAKDNKVTNTRKELNKIIKAEVRKLVTHQNKSKRKSNNKTSQQQHTPKPLKDRAPSSMRGSKGAKQQRRETHPRKEGANRKRGKKGRRSN